MFISCQDLLPMDVPSLLLMGVLWMIFIRLASFTIFPRHDIRSLKSFLLKILWILLPLERQPIYKYPWPIGFDILSGILKLVVNHWFYRYLSYCGVIGVRESMLLMYGFILTIPFLVDFETALIRIVTRDRYTLQSFTNFTYLSCSLREFWGCRYNRIVNIALKETIFDPVSARSHSRTLAAILTFMVSGIFHAHIVMVIFNDLSSALPAFVFFLIHGIACAFEKHFRLKCPEHVGCLMTHSFLWITTPIFFKPLIQQKFAFIINHPPPLADAIWFPKLPLPDFCSVR